MSEIHDEGGKTVAFAKGNVLVGLDLGLGVDPRMMTLPIVNLPPDTVRVKRRMRNNDFARAFVKTKTGIREFYLVFAEKKTALALAHERGANVREEPQG